MYDVERAESRSRARDGGSVEVRVDLPWGARVYTMSRHAIHVRQGNWVP